MCKWSTLVLLTFVLLYAGRPREPQFHGEHRGQKANVYNLSGLITALAPYAQEEIDLREANKGEQAEKPIRQRPRRLAIVKTDANAAPRPTR